MPELPLSAAPEPPPSDLPASWSAGARETFEAIQGDGPDMTASEVAALWQAAALESAADHLEAVAQAVGWTATGSTGQVVTHPAATEARLCRTQAATIFARLVPAASGAKSNSTRGREAARARWSR